MRTRLHATLIGLGHACLVLALVLGQLACHSWYPIHPEDLQTGRQDRDHNLELTYSDGRVVLLEPYAMDYPNVTGRVVEVTGTPMGWDPQQPGHLWQSVSFDLEKAQVVRLWKINPWKAVALSAGIPVGILLIIIATKQSCPFIYVDEGSGERLVGEGYPSAICRSIQREDLLQLPVRGGGDLKLRLANLVDETQYTDRLDLLSVDHARDTRALATMNAQVVVVGPPQAPLAARDLEGQDCLAQVAAVDQVVWKTDLQRVALQAKPPLREGLSATFAPIPGRPVLEVQLRSTRWLETVTGRYFAAMGEDFPALLERMNTTDAKDIQAWRHQEGIDLRAEVRQGGRWRPLGYLYPTGAAGYRRIALPFPADWQEAGPIQVRLSGGTGFWWVDALALSALAPDQPAGQRVAILSAKGQDGSDQRPLLEAADGRYQILSQPGEEVDLRFKLPPLPEAQERTVFLRIQGYYNPHAPAMPRKSLLTLFRMQSQEGAFARFGLDYYREHRDVLHSPGAPESGWLEPVMDREAHLPPGQQVVLGIAQLAF